MPLKLNQKQVKLKDYLYLSLQHIIQTLSVCSSQRMKLNANICIKGNVINKINCHNFNICFIVSHSRTVHFVLQHSLQDLLHLYTVDLLVPALKEETVMGNED